MEKKRLPNRFIQLFDPAGVRKYVTQVSLILLSLFIATSADRCREAAKDKKKLKEYLTAVHVEIQDELKTCRMNLRDCERDQLCLGYVLHYAGIAHPDSQAVALQNFAEAYQRGVFRTFPPTTFEVMNETGDISLLKNATIRSQLASAYAFRRNVIQKDLADYDQATQVCAEKMGEMINLSTLLFMADYESCMLDRKRFISDPHNEVFLLLRMAHLRGFHLDYSINEWQEAEKSLSDYLKTL